MAMINQDHKAPSKNRKPPHPPLLDVQSSSIAQVGYEHGTLYVRFVKGKLYSYPGVTPEQYAALRNAKSIGLHLQTEIMPKSTGTLVPEADGA